MQHVCLLNTRLRLWRILIYVILTDYLPNKYQKIALASFAIYPFSKSNVGHHTCDIHACTLKPESGFIALNETMSSSMNHVAHKVLILYELIQSVCHTARPGDISLFRSIAGFARVWFQYVIKSLCQHVKLLSASTWSRLGKMMC